MMYQVREPFTNFDHVLLSRLSGMISLELQKSSFYKINRGTMYSYLLADLLDSNVYNHNSVRHCLQVLGFTLKEKLFITAVRHLDDCRNEFQMELAADQMHSMMSGSMYVIYKGYIILLISRGSAGITEFEGAEVQRYLLENNMIAGLSNSFGNIQEIRRYYHQAVTALELGKKLFDRAALYEYDKLSIMHMLDICATAGDLWNFCSPELITLKEYDRKHNTDYMVTLYQYTKSFRNSAKAASALNLHKNTMLYRIEKIKGIIGCDLENEQDLMKFNLSFRVLQYLKQFEQD